MKLLLLLLFIPLALTAQPFSAQEISRWQHEARQVTVIRDNWGIPHVFGKTDADCVFGIMYAQCEDDFKRIENNYIDVLGRSAEIKGESALYSDLLNRMVIDSAAAIADYDSCEPWLRKLLQAYADGMNYYLYRHPSVHPALLYRFEPWYPLMWTDGSISAINTAGVTAAELKEFYTAPAATTEINTRYLARQSDPEQEPATGSNGFAIAPARTANGHAILYINPHVSFYFRPEVHMISEEGLNAYGAVTWGQFFVYQGFNEHCGWMHTSSYADVADLYAEQIETKADSLFYRYEGRLRAVQVKEFRLRYMEGNSMQTKTIRTFFTHHGPVMTMRNGLWISVKSNNRSLTALVQSWRRTKANGFEAFRKNMELLSNNSNNTVFADDRGHIAYWHSNFIPRRDTSFDWSQPVDGTTSATEWKGRHPLEETIHLYNPASGWIQNCNSTPFTSSGASSPKKENYPAYMAPEPENFRGINAVSLLSHEKTFTINKIIAAGYNTYLAAFENLIPALTRAYDGTDTLLRRPIQLLGEWNLHSADSSIATTLAIEWGQKLLPRINNIEPDNRQMNFVSRVAFFASHARPEELLQPLHEVVGELRARFGTWQMPWGALNRFQRLTGQLQQTYDDEQPSLPVGRAASLWGCIPSFVSGYFPGAKKRYGYNGNSFICAVEFGKKIRARSLLTGGESSDPASPHFFDQGKMYAEGRFKDVLFYKEDILKHAERTYHPGQ